MENLNNQPESSISPVGAPEKNKALSLPSAIVVAAIIIAGAVFLNGGTAGSALSGEVPNKLDLISTVTAADFVRGDEGAPVTIIEYADFSCGYCGVYHPTLQKIVKEYDGQVKWVYRHLPIFNIEAAVASQCVGNLGGDTAFWNFADTMYLNRDSYSSDFYRQTALAEGIVAEEYDACIASPLVKSKIQKDFNQGKILLGFNATPYSVIVDKNGQEFSFAGALPYDDVKSLLDTLLQ